MEMQPTGELGQFDVSLTNNALIESSGSLSLTLLRNRLSRPIHAAEGYEKFTVIRADVHADGIVADAPDERLHLRFIAKGATEEVKTTAEEVEACLTDALSQICADEFWPVFAADFRFALEEDFARRSVALHLRAPNQELLSRLLENRVSNGNLASWKPVTRWLQREAMWDDFCGRFYRIPYDVNNPSRFPGFFYASSNQDFQQQLWQWLLEICGLVVGLILASAIATIVVSRMLTRSLQRITQAALHFGRDESISADLPVGCRDEIGILA